MAVSPAHLPRCVSFSSCLLVLVLLQMAVSAIRIPSAITPHRADEVLPLRRSPTFDGGFPVGFHGTGLKSVKISNSSGALMDSEAILNINDNLYLVTVTVGGQDFIVQLDTGSSDLWISSSPSKPVHLTNTTNVLANITYAGGSVEGPIAFAEVKLGAYTIPSQAFINAATVQDLPSEIQGILGMGFDISNIHTAFVNAFGNESAADLGRGPISNIFFQNASAPNSFDILLSRTSDLDDVDNGTFIISEHDPEFASVINAPKLPQVIPGHWTVVLDGMDVNGNSFAFNHSFLEELPLGKTIIALDTGFTLPPIQDRAVDFIYGSIEGAVVDAPSGTWLVPCHSGTNVTFTLGGQPFPIHPLDLTIPRTLNLPINGTLTNITVCINTYQYISNFPGLSDAGVDSILGDAFFRNAYSSYDYGDYDPTQVQANGTDGLPFVQLISTTDLESAWTEFQVSRDKALQSLPPALDPAFVLKLGQAFEAANSSSNSSSPDGSSSFSTTGAVDTTLGSDGSSNTDQLVSLMKQYAPIIIGLLGGNLLVGILLFAVGLSFCARGVIRSGVKSRNINPSYAPVRVKENVDTDVEHNASYHD